MAREGDRSLPGVRSRPPSASRGDVLDITSPQLAFQVGALRSAVTIVEGVMAAGDVRVMLERDDPTSVLNSYLRLVRSIRDQRKAQVVALRRDDIERLAEHLQLDGAEVLERLAALMGATAEQRVALGSLFAAGALVIGLAASGLVCAGPLTFVAADNNSAVVIDVAASTGSLLPAVRLHPPAPAPTTTLPPTPIAPVTVNRSGCNTDTQGAVMSLTIPSISYLCPVHAGGQALLDSGYVTLVTDVGPSAVLATRPGAPGTLWLAGHRASHGGAFAEVPGLANGAIIVVANDTVTATYRVVGMVYVEVRNGSVVDSNGNATADATLKSVIRDDMGGNLAPRLVLQTCDGSNYRWMIYADLVNS